ncbi:MAG: sulfurtransferase, partial [Pseudomonadales bacterium]
VLDGGFSAWQAAGLATEATQVALPESEFAVQTSLCKTVTAEELLQPSLPMLDARDEKRFRGEQEPIDPIAGHIPGALCLPFINNLTLQGHFKSRDELRAQIADLGFSTDQAIICYCGSGVTACHNILALRHAGFPEPYLYPGSWSEWITDPDRPIATV